MRIDEIDTRHCDGCGKERQGFGMAGQTAFYTYNCGRRVNCDEYGQIIKDTGCKDKKTKV